MLDATHERDAAIIARDRELEARVQASEAPLMEHRWHWTLDQSNPERMVLRAYARLVGRGLTTIRLV